MSILGAAAPPGAIVVNSSTPLWYLTRATGLVALVLLTASMALGLLSSVRYQRPAWPRFVIVGLHRNASLLALVFTGLHIVTTLADSYAPIKVQDVVIPFISAYRPLWLGLGTVAFDLMIALIITSLVRTRISYRSWHLVHWSSYLCWPVAVLHGLGTGSDTPVTWVLGLTVGCVALIAGLTGWRLGYGWPTHAIARLAGALVIVLALIAGGAWLADGPLQPGWARRSGTPPSLITGGTRAAARREAPAASGPPPGSAPPAPPGSAPPGSHHRAQHHGLSTTGLSTTGLSTAAPPPHPDRDRAAGTGAMSVAGADTAAGRARQARRLPRLIPPDGPLDLADHLDRYGPVPFRDAMADLSDGSLIAEVEAPACGAGAGRASRRGARCARWRRPGAGPGRCAARSARS